MKKLIFILAVLLLAIPSWAGVTVSATADSNEVTISYQMDGDDANLPRAFGLDVSVSGAVIVSGPVVNVNDYYVAPGTYEYDPCTPNDVNWGDPVVGLTATGFTLEAGSLYDDDDPCHPIAPDSNGWLCKFYLDTDAGFYVDLEENAARAGVVMEDTEKVWPVGYVVLEDANVPVPIVDCFPSTPGYAVQKADWDQYATRARTPGWTDYNMVDVNSWCTAYQCDGDASTSTEGWQNRRVFILDLTLLGDNWKCQYDAYSSLGVDYSPANPRADVDHAKEGWQNYRVFIADLTILGNHWQDVDGDLPGDCPRPD